MSTPRSTYRQYRFRRPPGACELLLVRHGESAAADPDRPFPLVDGQGDPPLHEDGLAQADRVCARLLASGETFDAVYVTPLQRTRQTAQPLLDRLGVEPVVEPDLREVFLGEFEGGEFRRRAAEGDPVMATVWAEQRWDAIPGAESDEGFTARVRRAIERIAAAHPDGTAAVFTHGGVIGKVMQLATAARPFAFVGADNASITHLVVMDQLWAVRAWNDTGHLGARFTAEPEPLL
jgi:probable phosphoglycerate mutase